jgi:hypothetical protein
MKYSNQKIMIKRAIPLVLIVAFLFLFSLCHRLAKQEKYYVISIHDSIIYSNYINATFDRPPPPPPAITAFKWYTDLVVVFDSSDHVYLYQTELTENEIDTFSDDEDDIVFKPEYPFFINLKPESLLAFDQSTFLNFIIDNNDIFMLDTNSYGYPRYFIIASQSDTIKNPAFYRFIKYITCSPHKPCRNSFNVRITTEEENKVIYYKTHKLDYQPEKINWTGKYLDGSSKPLTEKYNQQLKNYLWNRTAKETFKLKCTQAPHFL